MKANTVGEHILVLLTYTRDHPLHTHLIAAIEPPVEERREPALAKPTTVGINLARLLPGKPQAHPGDEVLLDLRAAGSDGDTEIELAHGLELAVEGRPL